MPAFKGKLLNFRAGWMSKGPKHDTLYLLVSYNTLFEVRIIKIQNYFRTFLWWFVKMFKVFTFQCCISTDQHT